MPEEFEKIVEIIDEDTKLIIDEEGLMYCVVTGEKARKIVDRALEVVNKRIEEERSRYAGDIRKDKSETSR
jgi:(2Fe-2S) ferredoxin